MSSTVNILQRWYSLFIFSLAAFFAPLNTQITVKRRMRTVVYAYQNTCGITVAYFAASVVLLVAETETGRSGTANATHNVKNTLAYRFSGLSLELSCLATLPTVSSNQKNMLEDT